MSFDTDQDNFRRIINDLDDERIPNQTSIGRIVTAMIAFFAVMSFIFILWYAYTEGKRQGLANIKGNQLSPNVQTQNNVPPTYSVPSSQKNQTASQEQNINALSAQNNLSQNSLSSSERRLPEDPTQPIALSDPNNYKKTSSVPPPPSLTSEPQNSEILIAGQKPSTTLTTEKIDTISVSTSASQSSIFSSESNNTPSKTTPSQTTPSQTTPAKTATLLPDNQSSEYGYILGASFIDQWRIQLASLRSQESVNLFWNDRKTTFPGLLGGLKLQIEKISISGRGDFFRVKAGPFLSRAEASRVCDSLKVKNIDCLIVRPS
jgi:cell division septation protein DedD